MDIDLNLIRSGMIMFLLLLASLTIHEWAHAFTADRLGDDTPRMQGRVTLNPLSHIDMIGSIVIPLINIFVFQSTYAIFGWGKPVMTHASNFKHPRRDEILTCLAGPGSNLLLALLAALVGSVLVVHEPLLGELFFRLIVMNVGLALFNLLPIPPLDGSAIIERFVPNRHLGTYYHWRARALPLVLAFVILSEYVFHFGSNALSGLENWWFSLISVR